MKTAPTNKKVRELIAMVSEGTLIPRPEFQRRLIWTRDDKNNFLDTVLRGYPFPEIYFADGDVDLNTGKGNQLLVDGQQRVTTLIQYFQGDPELKLTIVPPYQRLDEDDKKAFLQYDVAVRDLGAISKELIIEVFKRINATKYALADIEINNAVYDGKLKKFAEQIAEHDFFKAHPIFNSQDYKRMGDLRFALSIVITMMHGYFNRDDAFEEALDRYNDDFLIEEEMQTRIQLVFDFLDECGFLKESRIWKKADFFSVMIELDQVMHVLKLPIQPSDCVARINEFFGSIDASSVEEQGIFSTYYKAALQASNDKLNRVRRGMIIAGIIEGLTSERIWASLIEQNLV